MLPKYVKRVRSKGHTYYYFDTGKRVEGKKVLARLPDLRDPKFGGSYAALMGHRNRGGAQEIMRIPRLVDLYQRADAYVTKSAATQKLYGIYLKQLADLLPTAPAAEVTRGHMQRLVDNMSSKPGAANAFCAAASAMFKWAKGREYVTANPCDDVEVPQMGEHDPWPDAILAAGLAAEDHDVRLLVHMLYFTAQRIGDVVRMTWGNFTDGRVRITTGKTKRPLDMPQHDDLKAELARAARRGDTVLSKDGKPMKEAAARYILQKFTAGLGHETVPHGLRKNAINALLEAGCSIAETAAISQQSLQMVEHYAKKRNQAKLADAAVSRWQNASRTYKTVENPS